MLKVYLADHAVKLNYIICDEMMKNVIGFHINLYATNSAHGGIRSYVGVLRI